jgi:hypothetical protein
MILTSEKGCLRRETNAFPRWIDWLKEDSEPNELLIVTLLGVDYHHC